MTVVELSYLGFFLLAGLVFRLLPLRVAILAVVLGGWLVLPVGRFPQDDYDTVFPFWIIGIALPSDMLITKAWTVPAVALFWAAAMDVQGLARWRPAPLDLPMLLWCLWPPVAALLRPGADPGPAVAAAYLAGSWGALWLLGRIWFADAESRVALAKGLALAGIACLPVALIETPSTFSLHETLYGIHPYRMEGADRPLLYRAVGFFEHGNQYGIWTSLCAVAAVWVAATRRGLWPRLGWSLAALLALGIGIVHQSRGAVILLVVGLLMLALWRARIGVVAVAVGLLAAFAGFGLHYSGALLGWLQASGLVPQDALVRGSAGARTVRDFINQFGLGTFAYRMWQDYQTRDLLLQAPWFGNGQWDWWRPADTRPWGFWVLTAGYLGVVGAGLALTSLLAPALARLRGLGGRTAWRAESVDILLVTLVLLALADAVLNSFLFFPAILIAGALAARPVAVPAGASPAAALLRERRG